MVENFNNAVINGYLFDEVLWNLFKASPCFVFSIKMLCVRRDSGFNKLRLRVSFRGYS